MLTRERQREVTKCTAGKTRWPLHPLSETPSSLA